MNNIKKQARVLRKCVKGIINVRTLMNFAETLGYIVVLYDNAETNSLIEECKATEYAKTKHAFTVINKRIIFINDAMHANDKVYELWLLKTI